MKPEEIKNLRLELDLNQEDFADLLEISKRSVANYESGETKPNHRTLNKLTKLEQEMLGNVLDPKSAKLHKDAFMEEAESTFKEPEKKYLISKGVPYYDLDFTASFLEVTNSQQAKPDHYVSHPFFKGCDFIVRASGQSMAKVIKHGDAIGLIEIKNWREFLQLGEIYAIVTDEYRMIKVLTKGDDNENFTLLSKPSDGKIEDFPAQQLPKKLIKSIFKVQASSHLF